METVGGKGGGVASKKRDMGESVAQNPNDSARIVLKKGEVTSEGNFGSIPASDNSAVHPYG